MPEHRLPRGDPSLQAAPISLHQPAPEVVSCVVGWSQTYVRLQLRMRQHHGNGIAGQADHDAGCVSTQESPSCMQKCFLFSNWERQWSLLACGDILPGTSVLGQCDSSPRPELISLLSLVLAAALRVGRLCPGCRLGWPLPGARSMSEQPWNSSTLFGLTDLGLPTKTSCFSGLVIFRSHGHS